MIRTALSTALGEWVIPALSSLPPAMNTLAARQQVLGTGYKESGYRHIRQLNGGPALSYFQIEPRTHDDLRDNYLAFRPDLMACVMKATDGKPIASERLLTDQVYAALICRLIYFRSPLPLPKAFDAFGQAAFWKKAYNGPGAGVISEAVQYFKAANEVAT